MSEDELEPQPTYEHDFVVTWVRRGMIFGLISGILLGVCLTLIIGAVIYTRVMN